MQQLGTLAFVSKHIQGVAYANPIGWVSRTYYWPTDQGSMTVNDLHAMRPTLCRATIQNRLNSGVRIVEHLLAPPRKAPKSRPQEEAECNKARRRHGAKAVAKELYLANLKKREAAKEYKATLAVNALQSKIDALVNRINSHKESA